jgi:hypothetical protein
MNVMRVLQSFQEQISPDKSGGTADHVLSHLDQPWPRGKEGDDRPARHKCLSLSVQNLVRNDAD